MNPIEINDYLQQHVIGQTEVLRFVSVAIFKHLQGEPFGNLMMMGNSGSGKTTVMRAMERLYMDHPEFEKYRAVIILNANTFATEEGVVDLSQLFVRLEERARKILGPDPDPEQLRLHMEHATVCIDEVDKVSGVIGGKPYVTGINIQQALLTLIEGEKVVHTVDVVQDGQHKKLALHIDTGRMLFLCAGAFEKLYDQVFERVTSPTSRVKLPTETVIIDGRVEIREYFTLRHHFQHQDLFDYGMQPQFLSRFDNAIILEDLTPEMLVQIFRDTEDSVFKASQRFFARNKIDLELTEEAAQRIALEAAKSRRIGARALKEVYGRIIKPIEYDPHSHDKLERVGDRHRLVIDEAFVQESLRSPIEAFM